MAKWLAKEFDWTTGRYTGKYYDIAEAGIVAVFVDSFYGDDTAAGTAAAPFKTLGKAITTLNSTGANGSRIFMNGVFCENLPAQTYWYEWIGCGGGANGLTVFYNNNDAGIRIQNSQRTNRFQNLRTLNYNDGFLFAYVRNADVRFNNCFLSFCMIGDNSTQSYSFIAFNTIFKDVHFRVPINTIVSLTISGSNNILFDCYDKDEKGRLTLSANNSFVNDINEFRNFINSGIGNKISVQAQFLNPLQNDFSVRLTSPLIQAGTVDEITGIAANVGGVEVGLPYNGITPEFTTEGGATITDLTIDSTGRFTITAPSTTGTLETATMDLGNIYPLENIDLFNVFDFLAGEITQGVFEPFSSPRMALTIKLKYGLTSAEVDDCPWLLIEYGKQPTFSGTGASRVGNADDTFDPDTFQTITCRYMKLFVTLQNNS